MPRGLRTPEQEEKYQKGLRLRADGETYFRISIECDVSMATVKYWFNPRVRQRQAEKLKLRRLRIKLRKGLQERERLAQATE